MAHPQSLGSDFDAVDDITQDWAMAPDERTAFAQACYRRLATAAGSLCNPPDGTGTYATDYGLGALRYLLEGGVSDAQIAGEIQSELLKDERVKTVAVAVTNGPASSTIAVKVSSHQAPTYIHTLTIDRVTGAVAMGVD